MNNDELLNTANREFEQILPVFSQAFTQRMTSGFQIVTLAPGLKFVDPTSYSAPGSAPNQTGPSLPAQFFMPGGNGFGDTSFAFFNVVGNPATTAISPTANPGSVPPVGPEEKLRYSCVSGKCLQDPNGLFLGIDECLTDGCGSLSGGGLGGGGGIDGSGGSGSGGCDCGFGPSHTTFKAEITSASAPYTSPIGSSYYLYGWTEVTARTNPRTSATGGLAINEHEYSVANNGGNTPPTGSTLTRLTIPVGARVPMFIDEAGAHWFHMVNPLQVNCS
jgi:hypothetical protein